MDEEQQAQQALKEMFRHDRAEVAAHPPRKPRLRDSSRVLAWVVGVAVFVVVILPISFIVIYPRFGPVDTMTSFCQAEADGEYASAYALLSQSRRQQESLADFTSASQGTTLVSCGVNGGIPFIFTQTRATLDVTYTVIANGQNSDYGGTMTFVRESGGWRVESSSPLMY
ncbi:MAG: hypothetical protein ACRDID_08780 [Ktedonobacterales bacterium]